MQAILDFFQSVGDILTGVINFFISLIKDIVFIVQTTAAVLLQIPQYFSWLPVSFLQFLLLFLPLLLFTKLQAERVKNGLCSFFPFDFYVRYWLV